MSVEQDNDLVHSAPHGKRIIKHPSRDVALQLVDTSIAGNITAEEERSALRRIDCVLMPTMFVSFALQYMDKACLTGAALFGILTDLDLVEV